MISTGDVVRCCASGAKSIKLYEVGVGYKLKAFQLVHKSSDA